MDMNLPPPWDHQKQITQRSLTEPDLALFWQVGTGKSRGLIDILRYRFAAHDRILRTVIFCPKIVCTNWFREIQRYSRLNKRDLIVATGTGAQKLKKLREGCFGPQGERLGKIVITNYDSLDNQEIHTLLMDWAPEVVVADEAHRLKNPEAKRPKKVIALGDIAKHRYALTGTPILNTALDVFNVFRFLDKGATFGKNYWVFRSNWFEDENAAWSGQQNYFPKYVPRADTYAQLNQLIYKKAMRVIKSECLDLPPFVRKQVFVSLSPEQARLYAEMKEDYIAYIDDVLKTETPRAVVAQMAVTKALRMQQIVTGYAKTDEGQIHKIEKNPRIEALAEMLEDLTPNHKVIVWSVFHENYADIAAVCKKLKIPFRELHGKVKQKDRDEAIDSFSNDPSVRVLIANQAAGGIGINLIASDVSIFYSKNFSLEQDIQAEGRNYRGGSERHKSVTRIDFVAEGTIDELIDQALAEKQDIGKQILDLKKDEF